MLELLITIVIVGLIAYVAYWVVGQIGLPEPFNKVILVILALIVGIYLINLLLKLPALLT